MHSTDTNLANKKISETGIVLLQGELVKHKPSSVCREVHEETNVLEKLRGISNGQVSKVQSQVLNPSHTVPLYHGCIFSEATLVGASSILCSLATVNITG